MELSLATPLLSRDGNLGKDPYMLNCYWESRIDGGHTVVRRPALGPAVTLGGMPAGVAQGAIHVGIQHYAIVNDSIYGIAGNFTPVAIPGVTQAKQRMDSVSNITNANKANPAFVKNNSQAWLFQAGAFAQVTNANYPATTVPGCVYLDSTYYVMSDTGQIWGSDLDNCQSWNALNYITVDRALGPAVALHRHLNYVVAFCEKGTQFFYDAANPSPGSPLSSAQNATVAVGCAHPDSVQGGDDFTIFLSQDRNRSRGFSMIQGLSVRKISTPDVDRILERYRFDFNRAGYSKLYSMILKADGHTFYVFNLSDKNLTLAYDVSQDHWAQWSSLDGQGNQVAFLAGIASYDYAPGSSNLFPFVIPPGGQASYSFGQGDQVGSEQILMGIRTRSLDAGTTARKVCSEISLLGDTVAATMNVRYTNDNGNTWSAWRGINLNTARKRLTRLGTFVKRMYEFQSTTSVQIRLESFVLPDRNLPARAQPTGE